MAESYAIYSSTCMEAQYLAASAATQETLWQACLIQPLGMRIELPIIQYEDNKSAIID
jgi:hypothetical protein